MPLILGVVGRGFVWGLSSLGLMKATETVTAATGGNTIAPSGPGFMAWAVVLGIGGFALWTLFKRSQKRGQG